MPHPLQGGTGMGELARGLATLPQKGGSRSLLVVRDRDGGHPRGPSSSALLLCV